MTTERWPKRIDRYVIFDEFASGGTASVHFGRLVGPAGFGRIVAVKRLRDGFVEDPSFVRMLIDEARLAARINHQNVVQTLDVLLSEKDTYVVMDYVRGVPLSLLAKRSRARSQRIDPAIASTVMANVLHGLHAAHEATDEHEQPLGIVHRDISPQNVLVGIDGSSRVLDFGIAKAASMTQATRPGYVKGKIAYISPEHLLGRSIDRRADIFAAGVILWELLTGQRLFGGGSDADTIAKLTNGERVPPSALVPELAPFDELTLSCLNLDPERRPPTARAMAVLLQDCWPMVPAPEIGEWVNAFAGDVLEVHRQHLSEIESYDLGELIALPDDQARGDLDAGEAGAQAEPEPSSEGEEMGSAGEPDPEEEDEQVEDPDETPEEDPSEVTSPEPEAPRLVSGRSLVAVGLVAAIGATVFGWRDQISEYLFGEDQPQEAKSASPEAIDSVAPQAVASADMPAAATPALTEPVAAPSPSSPVPSTAALSPSSAVPSTVVDRPARSEGARPNLPAENPGPSPRPRTERIRQTPPAERSPIVRSFPTEPAVKSETCSPPYRIDSDGIKIYKVECL